MAPTALPALPSFCAAVRKTRKKLFIQCCQFSLPRLPFLLLRLSPSLPLQLNSTHQQQQQQLRAARSLIVNNLGHSAAVSQSVALLLLLLLLLRFALFHCRHAAAAFFKHATPPPPALAWPASLLKRL